MLGHYGFGNGIPSETTCPSGGESWCYNPLVMHIQQNHPGVLSTGSASDILNTLKLSLKEAGYIPTSDLNVLITPVAAVSGAVGHYQPYLKSAVCASTQDCALWKSAVQANTEASQPQIALRKIARIPTIKTVAPPPSPSVARIATIAPLPAAKSEIPWVWIGVGAAVLGGVIFLMTKK